MKKANLVIVLHFAIAVLLLTGCKKEYGPDHDMQTDLKANNNDNFQNSFKHADKYNADGITAWMALQLRVIRTSAATPPAIHNSRYFAYCGIAVYEALVNGMQHHRSLY